MMKKPSAMEEITQAAKASYDNFSETEKISWEEMFKKMDKNGDGMVSLQEYVNSKEEGDPNMVKPNIFKLVDRRNDGNLKMEEFYTLCYIIASGRPTCRGRGCDGDCIAGLFFTCTACRFDSNVRGNFDLCISCYQTKAFKHEHAEFVDNYMLLADMQQKLLSGELQDTNTPQFTPTEAEGVTLESTTSGVQSFNKRRSKRVMVLKALKVGKDIATAFLGM